MTNRKIEYWVIPPEADAEFVANMEEVLETYAKPYDPTHPVLCMDERAGTANIFMFTEPLSGWRMATARQSKTKVDWALEMARLLDSRYKRCEKVILVCDNLNTHTKGAFYEAFKPAHARRFVRRIEFRHTPKHGSWLNIAENELSSMTRQCIGGRRIGDLKALREQIRAWSNDVNKTQRGVDWQMKIDDARCKPKSVYPKLKL